MVKLVLRRLVDLIWLVLAVELVTLTMLEFTPGSYCGYTLPDHASVEVREACEASMPSFWWRYAETVGELVHLNLGTSLSSHQTVALELAEQLPSTLRLGLLSFGFSIPIGVVGGMVAARYRFQPLGQLVNWGGIAVISLPSFVLALVLIKIFALRLGWVRVLGNADEWRALILPIISISLPLSAWFMRITRNAIVDVLNRDYIRTAQAKGLGVRYILLHHALRNALSVIIPLVGLVLAGLLDGTLLIEIIFNRPGLGRYTLQAVQTHNYPALQGVVLLVMFITVLSNLLADLLQSWLLPQSRGDLLGANT